MQIIFCEIDRQMLAKNWITQIQYDQSQNTCVHPIYSGEHTDTGQISLQLVVTPGLISIYDPLIHAKYSREEV